MGEVFSAGLEAPAPRQARTPAATGEQPVRSGVQPRRAAIVSRFVRPINPRGAAAAQIGQGKEQIHFGRAHFRRDIAVKAF